MPGPDLRQYKELMRLMQRASDRDDTLEIIRTMPSVPSNEESYLTFLRSKIDNHARMWSENKSLWRQHFWAILPYRQSKRWIEKHLGQTNFFRSLTASLSVSSINHTENWSFKEFWQRSLMNRCQCRATNRVDNSEEHQRRLKFDCPKVEPEHKEILQGRTPEEVRSFVLNASLFRLLKLGTKWRVYREPSFELLYKSGQQFFKLCSSSEPACGRRQQNV